MKSDTEERESNGCRRTWGPVTLPHVDWGDVSKELHQTNTQRECGPGWKHDSISNCTFLLLLSVLLSSITHTVKHCWVLGFFFFFVQPVLTFCQDKCFTPVPDEENAIFLLCKPVSFWYKMYGPNKIDWFFFFFFAILVCSSKSFWPFYGIHININFVRLLSNLSNGYRVMKWGNTWVFTGGWVGGLSVVHYWVKPLKAVSLLSIRSRSTKKSQKTMSEKTHEFAILVIILPRVDIQKRLKKTYKRHTKMADFLYFLGLWPF